MQKGIGADGQHPQRPEDPDAAPQHPSPSQQGLRRIRENAAHHRHRTGEHGLGRPDSGLIRRAGDRPRQSEVEGEGSEAPAQGPAHSLPDGLRQTPDGCLRGDGSGGDGGGVEVDQGQQERSDKFQEEGAEKHRSHLLKRRRLYSSPGGQAHGQGTQQGLPKDGGGLHGLPAKTHEVFKAPRRQCRNGKGPTHRDEVRHGAASLPEASQHCAEEYHEEDPRRRLQPGAQDLPRLLLKIPPESGHPTQQVPGLPLQQPLRLGGHGVCQLLGQLRRPGGKAQQRQRREKAQPVSHPRISSSSKLSARSNSGSAASMAQTPPAVSSPAARADSPASRQSCPPRCATRAMPRIL